MKEAKMLVWACIAPHGGELIPELGDGYPERMAVTRKAMLSLGQRATSYATESIIVYAPHGLCVDGYACVSITRTLTGHVSGDDGARVSAEFNVDFDLATQICAISADTSIPTIEAAYQKNGERADTMELDWGALVPLWFMGAAWHPKPKIVTICPSRLLSRKQLILLGRLTAQAAQMSPQRVAIICSADQGHGHGSDGPYGHSPTSLNYDMAYCRAIRDNALHRLLRWSDRWVNGALPDSYWQTLILYGAQMEAGLTPELLSYEAPTYFGMACAEFKR